MARPRSKIVPLVHASLLTLGALAISGTADAQQFAYCDLSVAQQTSKLQLNGATVVSAGLRKQQGIRVTSETTNQRSTVYHKVPITFAPGTSLYQHFRVRIDGSGANLPPNGADGFSFMIQNDPGGDPLGEGKTGAGLTAVGRNGEGFAYAGITQSFALELDTYQNSTRQDPNGNHIGLDFGGHNHHTTTGATGGVTLLGRAEGSTVVPFQPINLAAGHSLESTGASYDTRDVWIDYVCAAGSCTTRVYMTFNNTLVAANFADPSNPATIPAKPATPILVTTGLADMTTYLKGTSGYAGFSASTGGSMDEHLVTYWVLSNQPFSDQNTNLLEDVCDCKNVPGVCGGNIPICDPSAGQGFCRDCLSNAECAAADPATPVCDAVATGGSGACVQCVASTDCPLGTPNCNTTTHTCTSACTNDSQCSSSNWCDNPTGATLAGTCTAKLPNGTAMPVSGAHTPTLDGTCTAPAATAVCQTGVCDLADNACGIALGDGTCTATGQCRAGLCIGSGANAGKCEPCVTDATCSGATPACNTATNQCTQCTATNQTACAGTTPVCNGATNTCVACTGDAGSGGAACPTATPYCNLGTGACTTSCTSDAQCGAGNWCNDVTLGGTCAPKQANGTPVPGGTCTASLGSRACTSAICDPADAKCGLAVGDGTCSNTGQCRSGACIASGANTGKCEPCANDSGCSGATPACDPATNQCVQCSGTNAGACTGTTPICNTQTGTCGGCTSDLGVQSTRPCTQPSSTYCTAGGACGQCGTSADCLGPTHAGPFCVNGSCGFSCSTDADCGAAQWCNSGTCAAKLPNGTKLPPAPPISGTCTPLIGQRVCLSAVCDTTDNECGLPNGATPSGGGSTQCRSGVVGADGKCGYANGEGPCTQDNGTIVCRSSTCGSDGKCGLPNGGTPTAADGGTTSGSTQCRSGVVGADGKCGYPNGEGPCRMGDVCRSGVCGSDRLCGLPDGKGPCTAATGAIVCRSTSCDTTTGLCGPEPVDSGTPPVTDSGTPPPPDAGTSCPGGAIGPDGLCGYPNGQGPCTASDGATVCRSGVCGNDGLCGLPDGEGPCSASDGATICRSGTCNAAGATCGPPPVTTDAGLSCPGGAIGSDGKCGYPNGEGPCTTANGGTVCRSGVCEAADGKCGVANGNTPPDPGKGATECRSGVLGADGKCGYPAGSGTCVDSALVCRSNVCGTSGTCGCTVDADCGGPTSGMVCDDATHDCHDGCRGMGGNACPTGVTCSSTTAAIGTCAGTAPPSGILEGGGCACSVPARGGSGSMPALLFALAAAASAAGRRRSGARRPRSL